MKVISFLIPFLITATLIQIVTEVYFALTTDQSPFWGYISFLLTAVLILGATWLNASRSKNLMAGVKAGFGLWIYIALLSAGFALVKHYLIDLLPRSPLALETKGYLISLLVFTPIALAVCWLAARLAATRRR